MGCPRAGDQRPTHHHRSSLLEMQRQGAMFRNANHSTTVVSYICFPFPSDRIPSFIFSSRDLQRSLFHFFFFFTIHFSFPYILIGGKNATTALDAFYLLTPPHLF